MYFNKLLINTQTHINQAFMIKIKFIGCYYVVINDNVNEF